jgi:hypothetical protein
MSVESLIKFRLAGRAPAAIWVVVGKCPERLLNLPDCIAVTAKPASMDWRSVVGLHVDIFDLGDDPALLDETIESVEGGFPSAVGVACDLGVVGLSDEHEFSMRAIRRHLADHP